MITLNKSYRPIKILYKPVQLFVDLDGVLADLDGQYEKLFGVRPDKKLDNIDWSVVGTVPDFYLNLPPMDDMHILWNFVCDMRPIILTGVPNEEKVPEAADNKRQWVRTHIGSNVEVRCCRSSEKCLHAKPGDILIDDWEKYRSRWEKAGGIWITHTDALSTIEQLLNTPGVSIPYDHDSCCGEGCNRFGD